MDNNDIFFHDHPPTTRNLQPPKYTRPTDDFRPLPVSPTTILYLAITTPHTDSYTIHGPVPSFTHLLPTITEIVSDSPSAIDKLESLSYSEPNVWGERTHSPAFETHGFTTFVVEGQRGTYTVLEILGERNEHVKNALPAPVYIVTRHGPLVHEWSGVGMAAKMGAAKGVAATSTLVGSFVERARAVEACRGVMDRLVAGEEVCRTEDWGKGEGGGVALAMGSGMRWEVRIKYEDGVMIAREDADMEGMGVGWRF